MASLAQNQAPLGVEITTSVTVDDLPVEILGEIFIFYIYLGHSAWQVALVCRNWQRTALGTPQLWTHITLASRSLRVKKWISPVDGKIHRSNGQATVCNEIKELEDALERTGTLPLFTSVLFHNTHERLDLILALMARAFRPTVIGRIRALHLDIYLWASNPDKHPTFGLTPGSFANLHGLKIGSEPPSWAKYLMDIVCTSAASSLRELDISDVGLSARSVDLIRTFVRLERIYCRPEWPKENTPTTHLPYLKGLDVMCAYPCLRFLGLPNLTSLVLYEIGTDEVKYDLKYQAFPELTTLQVKARHLKWMDSIKAPKLQSLSIEMHRIMPTTMDHPSLCLLPTVSSFSYSVSFRPGETSHISDIILLSALQAVPNAVFVKVEVQRGVIFPDTEPCSWVKLLDMLSAVRDNVIVCSKLQDLILVAPKPLAPHLLQEEDRLLHQFLHTRKEMGRDLHQLVTYWKNRARETEVRRDYVES